MWLFKTVLRVVTNQGHLLATVLDVLVYESQPGTILLSQLRLARNRPRLLNNRPGVFENIHKFHRR